jgi:hypothetical protein
MHAAMMMKPITFSCLLVGYGMDSQCRTSNHAGILHRFHQISSLAETKVGNPITLCSRGIPRLVVCFLLSDGRLRWLLL